MRPLIAEALGTLLLLTTIIGSGIMGEALAAGQAGAALLPHAMAIGAMLFVLITLLGPISGAHFNPAVTLVFLVRKEIAAPRAAAYVAIQIAAGIAGAWLAHLMFDLEILQTSTKERTGLGQWSAEIVATAGLILVILGGVRTNAALVPALVGLYIMAALWVTASTGFANPAVTVARMLTDTFSGIAPADVPAFIAAQVAGALIGWQIAGVLWPASVPDDATNG